LNQTFSLLKATAWNWQEDRAQRMGAALAYYAALSLAPTVAIVLAVAGWAFGAKAAEGRLLWEIQDLVGHEGAVVIQTVVDAAHQPGHGIAATVLGLLMLFLGATAVVSELRDALNTIWKVPDDSAASTERTVFNLIKDRLLSFALVVGAGVFLLGSLVVNVWITFAGKHLHKPPAGIVRSIDGVISVVVITAMVACIFKILPNVPLRWRDVGVGAVFTAILFTGGKILLALYLAKAGFADAYGAAGSLVVLLVWMYYSAQVLYFGAEFTRVYAQRFGSMRP
jgi:membrane protein